MSPPVPVVLGPHVGRQVVEGVAAARRAPRRTAPVPRPSQARGGSSSSAERQCPAGRQLPGRVVGEGGHVLRRRRHGQVRSRGCREVGQVARRPSARSGRPAVRPVEGEADEAVAQLALELAVPLVGELPHLGVEPGQRVGGDLARFAGRRGRPGGVDQPAARPGRRGRRPAWRSASAGRSLRRGQKSRGRKLTIVSIMSSGAGSVGVSARPALPTTMSTSGNRQRIMSRAFRSSADCVTEARGTVIGMSITIPSSSGVMNSRPSGVIVCSATSATTTRLDRARHAGSARPRTTSPPATTAANSVAEEQRAGCPAAARPEQERDAEDPDQRRRAGRAGSEDRAGRPRSPRGPAGSSSSPRSRPRMKTVHRAGTSGDRQHGDRQQGERLGERQRAEHLAPRSRPGRTPAGTRGA